MTVAFPYGDGDAKGINDCIHPEVTAPEGGKDDDASVGQQNRRDRASNRLLIFERECAEQHRK